MLITEATKILDEVQAVLRGELDTHVEKVLDDAVMDIANLGSKAMSPQPNLHDEKVNIISRFGSNLSAGFGEISW